ncbi:MAG TPA: winged helix-turn-helix domain-containing protein, partial [Vicinamibacterales bacterium]
MTSLDTKNTRIIGWAGDEHNEGRAQVVYLCHIVANDSFFRGIIRKHLMRHPKTASEIELDLGRYELRRSGRRIKLEKKPMELLILLVRRRDQLVSRTDIVAQLWRSNLFVDVELNINNVVRKIRTALGDDSERPRFIETVVGKGYRFV